MERYLIEDNLVYCLNDQGTNEVAISIVSTPRNKICEHYLAIKIAEFLNKRG